MKKITLLLLILMYSFTGYSQFGTTGVVEGFESTTGPDAMSTNWTLGSGNWFVFDNGVPTVFRWGISTNTATPTQVYQGLNSAYINRETNWTAGQTIQDYLASPAFTVPANGQLRFWTRGFFVGNQNPPTIYRIMIAPANAPATDPNSYIEVQQWTDANLTTSITQYEEKVVDISAYAALGLVRIAFVMEQAVITAPYGDRWFVDNVQVVAQCFDPTALTATPAITSAQLSWTNPGTTSWEVELLPAGDAPTGTGTVINGAPSFNATTTLPANALLTATTAYKYYVRAVCSGGVTSQWVGPFNFSTLSPGLSCAAPIVVGTLPYSTTDTTNNYADNTDVAQPAGCAGAGTNYMAGNEVFYSYTAPVNGTISVSMTPTANNSSIFVYDGCSNVTVACLNGVANTNNTIRTIPNIPVIAGHNYIIVISSSAATQTVGYTLIIQEVNCANPATLNATGISQTGATLSWAQGGATSWQIEVQSAGAGVPAGAGATTTDFAGYVIPTTLSANSNYEFYVRADCGNGTFSAWSGPFVFRTLCDAFTVPFQEGFNSTSSTEGCWTVRNVNGDADSWNMNYTTNPFEGDQVAILLTDGNAGANDDWLISPQIILTGNQRLRYRYRVQSATEPNDFRVMLSENGTSPTDFTTTLLPLASYNNITYMEAVVNLSAYTGPINIAWHVPAGGLDGWRLYIDNVIIEDLPTCPEPSMLASNTVLSTSANITWVNGNTESEWQILTLPCGSPAPNAGTTGFVSTMNASPYPLTGLAASTCFDVYIRAVCPGNDLSPWTGPTTFSTQVAPPVCGGQFTDAGGPTGQYTSNANETVTICPTTPGDQVTVTFTAFDLENNFDFLKIYDGDNIGAPQLANLTGTALPSSFTGTSASGCLTFVFTSDGSVTRDGWIASVTCSLPPTCRKPTAIVSSIVTSTTVNLTWTQPANPDTSVASLWNVLALPCGSPAPTAASTGFVIANTNNPFILTGLTPDTCYYIYIRAVCSDTDSSLWSAATTITTQIAPPACGGTYTDPGGATANYPANSDSTVTICPPAGEVVTVTFTVFNTENSFDGIYVYDGNSNLAPQIPSANGVGFGPMTIPGGFWGTTIPGPFTSTSNDGCLTFNFRSDGSVQNPGFVANVTCAPAPNCQKPTNLTTTEITANSALLGWTEPNPLVVQWEVLVLPFGSPVPLPTATGTIVSINPALFSGLDPGTRYTFYVRGICPTSGTSTWSTGANFNTLVINDNCSGAIFAPVNSSSVCQQVTPGTVAGATASIPAPQAPCVGTADDDVWFQFIATNSYLNVALQNLAGGTNLNFAAYSGQCDGLTQIFCSAANALSGVLNNLVVGQTYYIRVYSNVATSQTTTFNLCISTPSTCLTGSTVCSLTDYANTTGVTSLGTIGCLTTSPNPAYFAVEVATTGPINFTLTQSTFPSVNGIPGTPNLDVDYAAWGPFANQTAACNFIGAAQPFAAPGIGVPVTQQTGCSYSAAPTETLNIANAQAGQIYIILITNFSNQAGYISLSQNNITTPGAGTTNCCPDAYFTYTPASFCIEPNATNPTPIIANSSIAGTFSSTIVPGLVFADSGTSDNSLTGEIDLNASLPGNYIITNTVAATATCLEKVKSYTVSLSAPTAATISYEQPNYCKSIATPQLVSQTGTTGGNYAVSPNGGLYINTTTGSITPSLSAPGVYTITYNTPGNGVCSNTNPSVQVEIFDLPNIPQPMNVVECNSYTLPALAVGGYYSQPGGMGIQLDVMTPLTASQMVYIYAMNQNGCTNEKSFNVTINTVPTPVLTVTQSSCTAATGTITVDSPVSQTGPTPSNLFISEVTDANNGSLTYVELFNGTGVSVNLANYKLKVYNNGGTMASCDLALTGTMANNSTRVIAVGSNTNQGGVVPNQVFATCGGVNIDDNIRLTTSANVEIDIWGRTDGQIFTPAGQPGYTYRRLASATHPSLTWNPADWTAIDPEDYTNVGSYTLATSNYSYSLDNGTFQTGTSFTGIAPGTHTIIVQDLTTGCFSAPVSVEIDAMGSIPSVTGFEYLNSPYCQNATNPLPTNFAAGFTSGGTYAEVTTTGLIINASTGEIDLATSTAGSHIVSYTVLFDPNTCQEYSQSTFEIVINPIIVSVVDFTYTSPVCQGDANLLPITAVGFTPNGVYSYTGTGMLMLNTVTGEIDVTSSESGSYEVVYTIMSDICNPETISAPIEVIINPVITPVVTFSYLTPVCQSSTATLTPTLATDFYTVTNGFSAMPAGLVIDTTSGEIDVTNSTAGIYTVTYTVVADPSICLLGGTYSFVVEITDTIVPVVDFTYTSPVCQDNANLLPNTVVGFTAAGAYSYTGTGMLMLNTVTGEIDVTNSEVGTYEVIYTVAQSDCNPEAISSPVEVIINPVITPVVEFSYTTPVCQSSTATLTPILATDFYSVTDGFTASSTDLVIDVNTGEIDVANSMPGIYTITYTVMADPSMCLLGGSYPFVVEIVNSITPVVGFSYTTPVCQLNTTSSSPTLDPGFYTGTSSNGFTATPAGLVIDSATGVIDVANSTPGTYSITYSVMEDASQCLLANVSSPVEFIITPTITPVTTISYTTPVCKNATTNPMANTSAAGFVSGGTYSEDTTVSTGLAINAATGEIDLANSTVGSHTVLYIIQQDLANCQAFSQSSAVITINAVVNAVTNFSYTTPVCANGTNPTPIPGAGFTAGGMYSYVGTGLDLNTSTGVINLATSTPATYTVSYTVVNNAATCLVGNTSTATITINPVITPVTGFSYTTPVCPDDINQLPSLVAGFTPNGTFTVTSGTGLMIDASTGEIDVQASAPGVYEITYTVAINASICQLGNSSMTQFVINSPFDIVAYGECQGASFVLSADPVDGSFDPTTATYEWENSNNIVIGTTQTIIATATGDYTVTVTSNGCSSTSAPFTVDNIACVIQKGISADGDGLNDNFELTGFDVKKLQIFNRYGMKVYSKSNYTNQWMGQSDSGDELPDATYYYVIERNNGEVNTGWIYLNRAQ